MHVSEQTPAPTSTLALPPVEWCEVTVSGDPVAREETHRRGVREAVLIADVTFGADQFDGDYKLYFTLDVDSAATMSKVRKDTTYADRIPGEYGYNANTYEGYDLRVSPMID